ncbi:MAG TPA: PKD-like domain-containing protein [Prolixibacteraceae bacterium]|nr:PKD-like domain-containing protein [Prolixibacteraceae bacterium]
MKTRLLVIAGFLALLFFNGCKEEEALPPKVPVVNATTDMPTIDSGTTASISLKSDVSTANFKWTVIVNSVSGASDGSGNSIAQTLHATGAVAGTATYIITPQANGVDGIPVSVIITVKPVVKITYQADVKQIFTTSCTPCHMTSGYNSVKLDNYTVAKSKITTILDRVQRTQGTSGFMPQGGTKISDENIATLKKWLADGLLEK